MASSSTPLATLAALVGVAALFAYAGVACVSSTFTDAQYACGPGGECPPATKCNADGFCRARGGVGDGGDDDLDGDIFPDADEDDGLGGDETIVPIDAACTGDGGPTAVRVPGAPGGSSFCIDSTEVTYAQYQAFVTATGAQTPTFPAECAGKTTLRPGTAGGPNQPVATVDWCDAWAYCKSVGKHLCGSLSGGSLPVADRLLPERNAWVAACTKGGAQRNPYGDAYDPGACNTGDAGAGAARDVGSFPKCVGGYPGLEDMVGNVLEWIDCCYVSDAGVSSCVIEGASYLYFDDCLTNLALPRTAQAPDVGFRCCGD